MIEKLNISTPKILSSNNLILGEGPIWIPELKSLICSLIFFGKSISMPDYGSIVLFPREPSNNIFICGGYKFILKNNDKDFITSEHVSNYFSLVEIRNEENDKGINSKIFFNKMRPNP